jgi:hypothetical protein
MPTCILTRKHEWWCWIMSTSSVTSNIPKVSTHTCHRHTGWQRQTGKGARTPHGPACQFFSLLRTLLARAHSVASVVDRVTYTPHPSGWISTRVLCVCPVLVFQNLSVQRTKQYSWVKGCTKSSWIFFFENGWKLSVKQLKLNYHPRSHLMLSACFCRSENPMKLIASFILLWWSCTLFFLGGISCFLPQHTFSCRQCTQIEWQLTSNLQSNAWVVNSKQDSRDCTQLNSL